MLAFGPRWRLFGHLYFFDFFLLFGVVVFPFLVVVLFVFVDFFLVGLLFFEFLVRFVGLIFFGRVFFLFVLVFLFFVGRIFFDVIFLVRLFRFVVFPGSFFRLVGFVFFVLVFEVARLVGFGDDFVAARCWNSWLQSVGRLARPTVAALWCRRRRLRVFQAAIAAPAFEAGAPPCWRDSQSSSEIRTSRACEPLYWPTMPSSAMKSISRAARP